MKKVRMILVGIGLLVILFLSRAMLVEAESVSLTWPVQNHSVTTTFTDTHKALDIISLNTAVYAAEAGEVVYAGWHSNACNGTSSAAEWLALPEGQRSNECGGYYIKIKHDNGNFYTWYFHLLEGSFPIQTRYVNKGQHIATIGESGTAQGEHLHFVVAKSDNLSAGINPQGPNCDLCLSGEPTPDTTPPNVELKGPASGQAFTNQLEAFAEAWDDNSQVKQVDFHLFHDGAWKHKIIDENGSDGWSAVWDISNVGEQNEVQVVAWAQDYAGNPQQSGAATNLCVDRTPPQVAMTSPNQGDSFDNTLIASADASDNLSGVAIVEFHFYYNGGWNHVITDHDGSDGWNVVWDTSGIGKQDEVRVLAWAQDRAGHRAQSGVIDGLSKVSEDTTPPTISIIDPSPNALMAGGSDLRFAASDNVGVAHIDVHIYYQTELNGPMNWYSTTINQQTNGEWILPWDFWDPAHRAIAQNNAWIEAIAHDTAGNSKSSVATHGKRYFKIMIKQVDIFVDARKKWPDMTQMWVDMYPVYKRSPVKITQVSGTAYSGANKTQPQGPEGDGSVCIPRSEFLIEGACKALVARYTHVSPGKVAKDAHVGSFYEAPAGYTGYLRLGFNDEKSGFWDNSGGFKAKLTIYPPDDYTPPTKQIKIQERSQCPENTCPHIEIWVESNGSIKKTGEWTAGSTSWQVRTRNEPGYPYQNLDAVWILYDNNQTSQGDRNYYIKRVNVDGVQINVTDPGVRYCRGKGTDPFRQVNCIPGQTGMKWNGATRFPF